MDYTPEQLAEMQQWANLGRQLVSNKKTKTQAEKLVKMLDPNIETSEDLAEPLLNPLREELAGMKTQLKGILDGAAAYNEEQKFASLVAAGYQPDGIEKIKGIMKERGISRPEDAVTIFESLNPAPKSINGVSPQNYGNEIFGIGEGEKAKERLQLLFDNQDAFIEETVREIATEFNNQ